MPCGRDLVIFEEPVETKNATGGLVIIWTERARAMARDLQAVRGREETSTTQGDRQAPVETWLLTVQFRSDLVGITNYRAIIDGVKYNIRSAMDRTRRRREITMEIETGVAI